MAAATRAKTTANSKYAIGLARARRSSTTLLASAGLLILLATLATGIVLSHAQARSQIQSAFALRGISSARSVSTYVSEQASRERDIARRYLSDRTVPPARFALVVGALGSAAGTLRDEHGHVLAQTPVGPPPPAGQAGRAGSAARPLQGTPPPPFAAPPGAVARGPTAAPPASPLPALAPATLATKTSISRVTFAPNGDAATAIAAPFSSAAGMRVFSVDYPASGLGLDALVEHAISYSQHKVFILDAAGRLLAASPKTSARTLASADPQLAGALARSSHGAVPGTRKASTFTAAAVPGTPWRLVIAVPDSRLFASISGWTSLISWLVFALVTVLGALLVALFARSLADRARLTTLSATMRRTAQTDSLTGLYNRRALTEHLTRAAARARRHDEPLSVLMIDLDRFKQTNDAFGHEAGDQVLCTIADCMRDVLRGDDVYGRWGGDEFLVALPVTDEQGAETTARAPARGRRVGRPRRHRPVRRRRAEHRRGERRAHQPHRADPPGRSGAVSRQGARTPRRRGRAQLSAPARPKVRHVRRAQDTLVR